MNQFTISDIRFLADEYEKVGKEAEDKFPERSVGKTLQFNAHCLRVAAMTLEQEEKSST